MQFQRRQESTLQPQQMLVHLLALLRPAHDEHFHFVELMYPIDTLCKELSYINTLRSTNLLNAVSVSFSPVAARDS